MVFDDELNRSASIDLAIAPSGTVLAYDMVVDQQSVLLRIEGLLSSTVYRGELPFTGFVEESVETWPEAQDASVPSEHGCDGRAGVVLSNDEVWCSFEHGLLRLNASTHAIDSIRLPVLSDAPGFGRLPQMVLAFGGEGAALEVEEGTLLTSARLGALNLTDPDVLDMTGVLPYAYGNDSSVPLTYAGDYTAVDGFDQLADLDGVVLGLVALTDAEVLALAGEDDRSLLMFSGSGFDDSNSTSRSALIDWFDERSGAEDVHLNVLAVKLDAAEQAQASSGALSAMFLVFGTFTIAAGILLSLTIIMLLADVRRSEVATVRALGLRRSDARAMFTYEGATLAFIASGVGSVMGLGLAWLIAAGFSSIFSAVGATRFVFDWTVDSFLAGWVWGALLAVIILWSSALQRPTQHRAGASRSPSRHQERRALGRVFDADLGFWSDGTVHPFLAHLRSFGHHGLRYIHLAWRGCRRDAHAVVHVGTARVVEQRAADEPLDPVRCPQHPRFHRRVVLGLDTGLGAGRPLPAANGAQRTRLHRARFIAGVGRCLGVDQPRSTSGGLDGKTTLCPTPYRPSWFGCARPPAGSPRADGGGDGDVFHHDVLRGRSRWVHRTV